MLDTRAMGWTEEVSAKRNPPPGGTRVRLSHSEPHSDGVGEDTVGTGSTGMLGLREQLGPLQGLCGSGGHLGRMLSHRSSIGRMRKPRDNVIIAAARAGNRRSAAQHHQKSNRSSSQLGESCCRCPFHIHRLSRIIEFPQKTVSDFLSHCKENSEIFYALIPVTKAVAGTPAGAAIAVVCRFFCRLGDDPRGFPRGS